MNSQFLLNSAEALRTYQICKFTFRETLGTTYESEEGPDILINSKRNVSGSTPSRRFERLDLAF